MAPSRRVLAVIVGVLVVAIGLYLGVMQYGAASKNPCSRYGPAPAGAVLSESSDRVTEHRSLWPIGSTCDWQRADGRGTVRSYHGDFAWSATTYAAIGGGLALMVVGVRRPRRDQPSNTATNRFRTTRSPGSPRSSSSAASTRSRMPGRRGSGASSG